MGPQQQGLSRCGLGRNFLAFNDLQKAKPNSCQREGIRPEMLHVYLSGRLDLPPVLPSRQTKAN